MSRPHSIRYIRQLMEWGFDKEFIAKDCGINLESLEVRLRRAKERERRDGNQGTESGTSSSQPNSISTAAVGDLGPLGPLADFHRAVHESLDLPEQLIVQLLERGAPEEHLPVIGMIASRAGIAVESVFELHRSDLSYLQISVRFGFGPEIFYVPMAVDPGPPYGKAWGYYKKTPRARWNTIRLTDVDVVNFVNVRVCHDHYGVGYDRIVAQRRKGKGFADIHRELAVETGKHGHGKGAKTAALLPQHCYKDGVKRLI